MAVADKKPGVHQPIWIWASDRPKKESAGNRAEPVPVSSAKPSDQKTDQSDDLQKLLLDNANVSATVFFQLLKSKGFTISPPGQATTEQSNAPKEDAKETNSASSNVQVLRGQKEADRITGKFSTFHFMESANADNGVGITRFKVCLIEEGMGNLGDKFYYTRRALESAVPLFEGKKFFVDHPDAIEERTRPERSVRDVAGYYENVRVEESSSGQGQLVADLVVFPDEPFRWVRAMMREAATYQHKHPDKSLIGLSINASGTSQPMKIADFLKSGDVPPSALPKLQKAMEAGVDEVKVVSAFKEAVSCDLVTEAGAGGKVLEMLESKERKSEMDPKEQKEKKEAKKEDGAAPAQKHDDAEQDKALIAQMIKKHMGKGDDSGGDVEESDMEAAHEAYEHFSKERKMEADDAAKHAAEAVMCSKAMMKKKESKQADADGDDDGDEKDGEKKQPPKKEEAKESEEAHKESADLRKENLRLKGELQALKEADRKREVAAYLEEKLMKSGLPRAVTKSFRESVKGPKTKEEVDALLGVFMEGYKATRSETGSGIGFSLSTEKVTENKTKPTGLGGCLK
jgi:hypothetical protein